MSKPLSIILFYALSTELLKAEKILIRDSPDSGVVYISIASDCSLSLKPLSNFKSSMRLVSRLPVTGSYSGGGGGGVH